jgi:hypothetical protein
MVSNFEGGVQQADGWWFSERGWSYRFDGISDYARVNDPHSALAITSTQISCSIWFNCLGDTGNAQILFCKPKTDGSHDAPYFAYSIHLLRASGTTMTPRWWLATSGAASTSISSSTNTTNGNWYHVVGTYDGANMIIYLNGKNVGSVANTAAVQNFSTDLYIGINGGLDERANCAFSDFRVYNRVLRNREIYEIYQGATPLHKADYTPGMVPVAAPAEDIIDPFGIMGFYGI